MKLVNMLNITTKTTAIALAALLAFAGNTLAQRSCGSMEVLEMQIQQDPKRGETLDQIEAHTLAIETSGERNVNGVITIPVVVHVLYNNSTENISDAQILSQIQVLNDDFRRLNADADDTWSQAADSEIEFCMATSDPNGNPTDGILRVPTSVSAFGTNDQMKFTSSGGSDAWPASDYLNMWVCDISGGILGYAQFPGGSSATDGVVCDYQYFGTVGAATAPFDGGRTTTHEVGHWLNLRHIWGDGGCGADDFVADTPKSGGANYGCAVGSSSCGSTDMVQNYMDYSDDACMNLYTVGQKNRMRALFESGGYRASLLASQACGEVVAPTCDDGIQNGGETGIDCGGPSCEPCVCHGVEVTVSFTFDNYPEETSWQISDGNAVVASGGTYPTAPDGSSLAVVECLPEACYTFTIFDSYGDGICCGYGNGSYSVTDEFGNVLASGASFASSEATDFCVSNPAEPTCDDGIQNGDETGVDCGGSCAPCATCDDGVQNGDETGVDCGGSCAPCATCDDGVQNGDETGVDCGGSCAPCATCDDGILNGDETGIDCGGSCPACISCNDGIQNGDETGIDCGGSCAPCATCDDGVQNGDETGVDCGGSCAPCATCDDGIQNGDETGVDCGGSCAACATCDDGIQNGDETGIDCGGSCAPCETGPCTYGVVDLATFEGGWGIWNDGGTDCRRNRKDRAFANGTFCVRIQDNTSTSRTYTDQLNLDGYEELTVNFRFRAESMENGEDFWLRVSTNGGASFTTVATYVAGTDFSNGVVYTDNEVVIPGPFSSSTVLQFQNDASNNSDRIYLDDIEISGCVVGGRWSDAIPVWDQADAAQYNPFQQLNVFPNPADDVVQLAFYLDVDGSYEIGVVDLLGRQLLHEQRTQTAGEQLFKIPTADWSEGTYILYLRSKDGSASRRFIIQR